MNKKEVQRRKLRLPFLNLEFWFDETEKVPAITVIHNDINSEEFDASIVRFAIDGKSRLCVDWKLLIGIFVVLNIIWFPAAILLWKIF